MLERLQSFGSVKLCMHFMSIHLSGFQGLGQKVEKSESDVLQFSVNVMLIDCRSLLQQQDIIMNI